MSPCGLLIKPISHLQVGIMEIDFTSPDIKCNHNECMVVTRRPCQNPQLGHSSSLLLSRHSAVQLPLASGFTVVPFAFSSSNFNTTTRCVSIFRVMTDLFNNETTILLGFLLYCFCVVVFSLFMIYSVVPKYGRTNPIVYITISQHNQLKKKL
jgi:hypothetical protein